MTLPQKNKALAFGLMEAFGLTPDDGGKTFRVVLDVQATGVPVLTAYSHCLDENKLGQCVRLVKEYGSEGVSDKRAMTTDG